MTYPKQTRYTLEEASRYIEYETGVPHTSNGLLQVAKNNQISICFYISDRSIRFIELDRPFDNWKVVDCEPLFGDSKLTSVVIPIDKPRNSHSINLIKPEKEIIFPILEPSALIEFSNNPNKKTVGIRGYGISVVDRLADCYQPSKIAIIQQRVVKNSNHKAFITWQKKHNLPTIKEGNFKYFETWLVIPVKRSELCIIDHALSAYIKRIKAKQDRHYPSHNLLNGLNTLYVVAGSFIELDILDLFIPDFSLEHFIQNLLGQSKEPLQKIASSGEIKEKTNRVEYNGQMIKPATKEKYEKWQLAVNEKHMSNPFLTHSAICTRIATTFKVSPETIRKNTRILSN